MLTILGHPGIHPVLTILGMNIRIEYLIALAIIIAYMVIVAILRLNSQTASYASRASRRQFPENSVRLSGC